MDGISAEVLKAGGETVVNIVKEIIDKIWKTGEWPADWTVSEIVTMPKIAGTQDCTKYRTLSLISQGSKILLDIIRQRVSYYVSDQIGEEQFGFVSGKGTTDAMLVLRNLMEKSERKNLDTELWLMFIDYAKAFDTVTHDKIWNVLIEFGVPRHLVWLIRELYLKAVGRVRTEDGPSDVFAFEKGVRQGCLLSPMLFNVIGGKIMRQVESDMEDGGCRIGGRNIWNLRYADDTTLLAKSKEELEHLAVSVEENSEVYGLTINRKKTNVMAVNGEGSVQIAGTELERVERFKYLGSIIKNDDLTSCEIRARIATAKSVMSSMSEVWSSPKISRDLKKRLVKSLIWSIALYGCESWTLRKADEHALEALEMWVWRRMLRVKWTDRKTNEWVRLQVGVTKDEGLLRTVMRRKIAKFSHWKRRPESLPMFVIESDIVGPARTGRPKTCWINNIDSWTVGGINSAMDCARRRQRPQMVAMD